MGGFSAIKGRYLIAKHTGLELSLSFCRERETKSRLSSRTNESPVTIILHDTHRKKSSVKAFTFRVFRDCHCPARARKLEVMLRLDIFRHRCSQKQALRRKTFHTQSWPKREYIERFQCLFADGQILCFQAHNQMNDILSNIAASY